MNIKIKIDTEKIDKQLDCLQKANEEIDKFIDKLINPDQQPITGHGLGRWSYCRIDLGIISITYKKNYEEY